MYDKLHPDFHNKHIGSPGLDHQEKKFGEGFGMIGSNSHHSIHSHGYHHPHTKRR